MDEEKGIGDYLFSFKRKFDNFWYHYKVAFIFGVLILAFIIFCIVQCASKVKGDADIGYIGVKEINAEEYNELQEALAELLGKDLNGDGKTKVTFTQFGYMTGTQLDNMKAMGRPVDYQAVMTAQTQMNLELTAGNIVIYFIDAEVYKELSNRPGLFMDLEDALGYMPENTNDACSIKLGSLPCWDNYPGLYNFPAGTIIAVRDILLSEQNNGKIKERYARNLILFKNMVEYTFKPEP